MLNLIPLPYRIGGIALLFVLWTGFVGIKSYNAGKAKGEKAIATFVAKANADKLTITEKQLQINDLVVYTNQLKQDSIKNRSIRNASIIREVPGPIVFKTDTVTRVELPLGWLSFHNAGAGNYDADSTSILDGRASGVTPTDALGLVVQNYGSCAETAQRLKSLQDWIRRTRFSVDSVNKARGR